jgi:putative iron-dependent peroxidase
MPEPQSGIIPEPGEHALFLVLRVRDPLVSGSAVAGVLAKVPALTKRLGGHEPRAKLVSVVGLGPEFWNVLVPSRRPRGFEPFTAIEVAGRSAPATGGDVLVHLVARRPDVCFDLALRIMGDLGDGVEVMDEVHGFRYLDARDLTGFIDGTENPKGTRERAAVALIGDEDHEFAGGSFVFTQRYVHDLAQWGALSVGEQEKVMGRRKRDGKELSEKAKPPTAHISRTVIEEFGEELEIVRHSFPYGTVSEKGLFFIAYTKDLTIPEKMLQRMMGVSGDGLHDRLMDYTHAVSGATFFAPSLKVLQSLAALGRS